MNVISQTLLISLTHLTCPIESGYGQQEVTEIFT